MSLSPKSTSGLLKLLLVTFVLLLASSSFLVLSSCSKPTEDKVIYEITGHSDNLPKTEENQPVQPTDPWAWLALSQEALTANITLSNPTGGMEQHSEVKLPCKFVYDSFPSNVLYVSAGIGGYSGTVTVRIYVNDELFKESTSTGAWVTATASGIKK